MRPDQDVRAEPPVPVLSYGVDPKRRIARRVVLGIVLFLLVFISSNSLYRHFHVSADTPEQAEMRYQVQANLDLAEIGTTNGNWADAQLAIDRARLAASANPTIFSSAQIRSFRHAIDLRELALRLAEAIIDRIPVAPLLKDLAATAERLVEQRRFDEARLTLDQLLALDPDNKLAKTARLLLAQRATTRESPTTGP
jgi:tetratricopeptide (TPR) repeat protein